MYDPFSIRSCVSGIINIFSVRSYMQAELTSQEVKKEVEQHLKDKERLEHSLPSSIVIGPFFVRVEAVRQALCNKRKALANAMLDHLVRKLRKQVDDVSHLFGGQKTLIKIVLNYSVCTVCEFFTFFFYTGPTFT